jgi:hypothetical protein
MSQSARLLSVAVTKLSALRRLGNNCLFLKTLFTREWFIQNLHF